MTATSAQSAFNANPFPDLPAIRGPAAGLRTAPPACTFPSPRFGDYSRTRFESRVAFGGQDEDAEETVATPTRQFSLLEITSGLPDDSREADERAAERKLRDLRGRVKAARAVVAATPGLVEVLARDWHKEARFYARFGITESQYRQGIPRGETVPVDATEPPGSSHALTAEVRSRDGSTLPVSGPSL